jgi:hypothetical protein
VHCRHLAGRGGARILRDALVTGERHRIGSALCVQDKAMKQAWCLVATSTEHPRKIARAVGEAFGYDR